MKLSHWMSRLKEWAIFPFEIAWLLIGVVILRLAEWLEDYPESNYRSPTSSDKD